MAITDPLVLSPDVVLLPVAELEEDVRGRFSHQDGDVAITHPRARTPSRVLDAGFLVAEGEPDAAGILPSLRAGAQIAGFRVRECVRGLEDTELYLVQGLEDRKSVV